MQDHVQDRGVVAGDDGVSGAACSKSTAAGEDVYVVVKTPKKGPAVTELLMAPLWCYVGAMPNLTLKDVPPALHARLRARAEQHHRSLNREAIACLEAAVLAERVDAKELLAKAAAARRRVRPGLSSSTIRRLVRTGRQ